MKHKNQKRLVLTLAGVLLVITNHHVLAQQPENASTAAPAIFTNQLPQMAGPATVMPLAADSPLYNVLGIRPRCTHVIDLLVRNCMLKQAGLLAGPHMFFGPLLCDMELIGVHVITPGNLEQGPVFQVDVRNNSAITVTHFAISAVGVLGQINELSPNTTVNIPRIDAGQTASIQIQLPAAVMSMGPAGEELVSFDTLVVALDSFDELLENNELNNVGIFKLAEIKPLASEAPAVVLPEQPTPNQEAAPVPSPADPAPASPLDQIDLDNLDLDDADEEAVRIEP